VGKYKATGIHRGKKKITGVHLINSLSTTTITPDSNLDSAEISWGFLCSMSCVLWFFHSQTNSATVIKKPQPLSHSSSLLQSLSLFFLRCAIIISAVDTSLHELEDEIYLFIVT
jgi:hypothetical protein